ncbi:hypothetical protein CO046_02840 [Candidatus Peregrinibacteria bacterium CG_4_9_14_0_2_um_filter_53_11]|nr:MAG: hypothetical protein CO046_02840 [Candidatus Peregrinibacteria bacterium CG_4_9_14_0_2_um_filter_53_11]
MRITVQAKPKSHAESIQQIDEKTFRVAVREAPDNGAANKAIEKLLAEFFDVAPSRVRILRGHTARTKIVEID